MGLCATFLFYNGKVIFVGPLAGREGGTGYNGGPWSRITEFLGPGCTPAPSFKVQPQDVRWAGVSLVKLPGSVSLHPYVGVLKSKTQRCSRKLVRVVSVEEVWDQCAIASSVQHNAFFARNCWHVNRLFSLCASYGWAQAPNERWIGQPPLFIGYLFVRL